MGTKQVIVNDKPISVLINPSSSDYISLTDMVKAYEGGAKLIEKWLSTKSTVDFLGTWEILNNPDFKPPNSGELEWRLVLIVSICRSISLLKKPMQ